MRSYAYLSNEIREFRVSRHRGMIRKCISQIALFGIITTLVCGLTPRRCGADPALSIWLVNSQGILVDATATTRFLNGNVYDSDGTVVGVVLMGQEGHVYGLNGSLIGVIVTKEN